MKEVALELDAMGYSYMKMQVWVVDTSKAKQSKTKQKRQPPHTDKKSTFITPKLRAVPGSHCILTSLTYGNHFP